MTRVLIIDDDQDVRTTLTDIVEEAGYEVFEAGDGDKGQRMFLANPMDVVITDILMPEKEGLETIRGLRKAHPNVRIIAISGGGRGGNRSYLGAAKDFGANHVLQKPISAADLLQAIQAVLTEPQDENRDPSISLAS